MDYDLAIFSGIDELKEKPPESFEEQEYDGKVKLFKSYENCDETLERVILDFLNTLDSFDRNIFNIKSVLQIGVYYQLKDSVTFTVRLGSSVLAELSSRRVSLEVSSYPCSE